MLHMLEALRRRSAEEQGQTMAEYSIVLAVITIGCVGAITLLGTSVISAITQVAGFFP
ncbi:MAG: Flp family type IVb pilin [Gaiellaceae bacterium]